jgi:hypothetical protein
LPDCWIPVLKIQYDAPSKVVVIDTEIETGAERFPTISTSPTNGRLNVAAFACGAGANANVARKIRNKINCISRTGPDRG